jgi:DNA helicase-2/ATP-dependent DNA helicase PcrA
VEAPTAARDQLNELRAALGDARALSPAQRVERLRRFYDPVFEHAYDNAGVRIRDLEQLEQLAGTYATTTEFLTDLTLDPPSSTSDLAGPPLLEEDYLILSTIHSAKGCEWDVVHVIHAADGNIPSDMATGSAEEIDEERRLLYVALTRAKDWLHVYFPLRYYHRRRGRGDAHSYAQLTRFISPKVKALFELEAVYDEPATSSEATSTLPAHVNVDSLLNELWAE